MSVLLGALAVMREPYAVAAMVGGVENWWLWQEGRGEDPKGQIVFHDRFWPVRVFTIHALCLCHSS